jgi:hypothetical protein
MNTDAVTCPQQEVRQKVEFADALGRQLEAARAERGAAEEAGRKQHALLAAKEEALTAALQRQQVWRKTSRQQRYRRGLKIDAGKWLRQPSIYLARRRNNVHVGMRLIFNVPLQHGQDSCRQMRQSSHRAQ